MMQIASKTAMKVEGFTLLGKGDMANHAGGTSGPTEDMHIDMAMLGGLVAEMGDFECRKPSTWLRASLACIDENRLGFPVLQQAVDMMDQEVSRWETVKTEAGEAREIVASSDLPDWIILLTDHLIEDWAAVAACRAEMARRISAHIEACLQAGKVFPA